MDLFEWAEQAPQQTDEDPVEARLTELNRDPRWRRLHEGLSPELLRRFIAFDRENPHVYQLFLKYAREALRSGRTHFSGDMIGHRIRWYEMIEASSNGFKMNDHHISFYVRKLIYEFPSEFGGFFELRNVAKASKVL